MTLTTEPNPVIRFEDQPTLFFFADGDHTAIYFDDTQVHFPTAAIPLIIQALQQIQK